ncbi:MAG: HAMP domain-containing histidine kinase, partial [Candidatus Obscuribacterales bacterium]|nr:HAMP domain-containing histidine kinase [Candidatus Obscuribacterales bacterium]
AKIMQRFVPISQEFRPAAIKARQGMRNAVATVIVFNILLVLLVAYILNKSTLSRLAILSKNMEQFAHGKPASEKLTGADELSELDKAFQEMSSKLIALEEHRQSMRAMVSHDLRSPLTSMILKTKIILSDESRKLPTTVHRDLKALYSEADRLRRLANTLLDIEKMEDGSIDVDLQPEAFSEILELSTESITSLCKRKQITVSTESPENCYLSCDKDRAVQVLINFLSNAVKFAPKKTELAIKAVPDQGYWRVEVHDQGPGVPADKRNKLFAKFIQLEQAEETKKEGSGLGLYICKLLIEAQKGEVGYKESELGGSCFYFKLKQASPKEEFLNKAALSLND